MGTAMMFVLVLAMWAMLMGCTVIQAAHHYSVVVQETVAGHDKVKWPDEPIVDWVGQAVTLCSLIAIWLAPVGILARVLGAAWLPGHGALRFFLLAAPVVWFVLPLSLLSSLGSSSRWQLLNGKVILGLVKLPSMLAFYPLTAVMLAVGGILAFYGLFGSIGCLPAAVILCPALLLIHARLVGRLGWLLQQQRAPHPKPTKRKVRKKAVAARDPWSEEDEVEDAVPSPPSYKIIEVAEPKAPRPHYMDPEPEPFTLAEIPPDEVVKPKAELNQAIVKREIELRMRKPPNPPPDYPMFSGVWAFPFYDTTLQAWFSLSLFAGASAVAFRALISLFPSGY